MSANLALTRLFGEDKDKDEDKNKVKDKVKKKETVKSFCSPIIE